MRDCSQARRICAGLTVGLLLCYSKIILANVFKFDGAGSSAQLHIVVAPGYSLRGQVHNYDAPASCGSGFQQALSRELSALGVVECGSPALVVMRGKMKFQPDQGCAGRNERFLRCFLAPEETGCQNERNYGSQPVLVRRDRGAYVSFQHGALVLFVLT